MVDWKKTTRQEAAPFFAMQGEILVPDLPQFPHGAAQGERWEAALSGRRGAAYCGPAALEGPMGRPEGDIVRQGRMRQAALRQAPRQPSCAR